MSSALPHAFGDPAASGKIKLHPEDFVVGEILGFDLTGEGEHVFLRIRKRGENTDYLARQIAKYAGLPKMAVSYAGMKDRHGITTQWFSVHIPGKRDLDWSGLESDSVAVLESTRHNRKLKTGALKGNRFEITVRELEGERSAIEEKLTRIRREGVPNYFGPQRFGREGNNLIQAEALFKGELKLRDRKLEGIYLSTARSHLFNRILARRVESGHWNQAIAGDVFMFASSHSFFRDELSAEIQARISALEIHPSGPLWGKGESAASGEALAIETAVAAELPLLCEGLARCGMETARRPLRLPVADLAWNFVDDNALRLDFSLPAGAYATVVLREAISFEGEID
ncbi:MAG: tRNA pseudouridine(13) synthase TruD [Methylococcaceae bacterium]|nr:tRNA pseudouridine(13) synthase TruD [Methylococcaceae bacterium]